MQNRIRYVPAALAAVWLVGGPAPAAAQPRSGSHIVIDFRPVGDDGKPVTDLEASEVTLRVGNRERPIKSFQLVRAEGAEAAPPAAAAPFATNAAAASSGRDVLIVVDEDSIAPGNVARIREPIAQLLAALTPADRVRLLSMRQGGVNAAVVPGKPDEARAALERISGHSLSTESATDLICRTGLGLQMLRNIFNGYSGRSVPTVVIVSAGFGPSPAGAQAATWREVPRWAASSWRLVPIACASPRRTRPDGPARSTRKCRPTWRRPVR